MKSKLSYKIFLISVLLGYSFNTNGQCPTSSFTVQGTACLSESISLINSSVNASSYQWDFCSGDNLGLVPSSTQIVGDFGSSLYSRTVRENNDIYTFIPGWLSDRLYRLDFGSSIFDTPTYNDLGDLEGMIDDMAGIDLIKEAGIWYGIATGYAGNNLYRLTFGSSLTNTPTVEDISGSLTLLSPMDIQIVEHLNNIYVFVVNNASGENPVTRLDFSTSILNTPSEDLITINGSNQLSSITFGRECDQWIGFVASRGNGKIFRMDLGNDPSSNPTVDDVGSLSGLSFNSPGGIDVASEGVENYVFVTSRNGPLYRLEFGNSFMNSPTGTDLGIINGVSKNWGIELLKESSVWVANVANFDGELYQFQFGAGCSSNIAESSDFEPVGVMYNSSETFTISLESSDSDGNVARSQQTVTVTSNTAPTINFNTDDFCITNKISFTSTADQTISTYSWDFGDGSGTSSAQNPSYTYASTGTYSVRLTVTTPDCGQFIEKEISVYNEPVAGLSVPPGSICTNDPISFTNTTTFDLGSPVSWFWDFGDSNTSTEFEPEHTYLVGGNYTVTLTTTLPEGCVSVDTQNISVEQGALPNFSFNNSCQGEIIQFNDLSSSPSPITNWDWDFGDGSSASIQNPAYSYTSVGTFDVTLSVTNQLGCVTSITQQVNNFANPIVDFDNDLSCSGSLTSFTDQSIVQDANISTWFWDFGTGNAEDRDTLQNPQFEYQEPGEYDVTLTVRSNFGCETTLVKPVTVNPGPIASFDWDESCLGSETQFINNTTTDPSNPLVSTVWTIEGNIIESTAPAYNFDEVGSYPVVLSVVAENFCESTQIDTVHVTNNPIANFNSQQFCDSDTILFYDTTIIPPGDSVNARLWDFGIFGTSTDSVAKVYWPDTESRVVKFQIGTDNGCLSSVNQSVSREIQPVASFEPSVNFGAAPLTVSFANFSENASGYSWEFGNGEVSDDENPSVQYQEEGIYTVLLNATTASGCADTVSQTIEVVAPEMEMELVSLLSRAVGDQVEVILNMANNGSIVVDESNLEIVSKIGTGFELTQDFDDVIAPNSSQNYSLNFRLNDNGLNRNQSICVELRTTDPDNPDIVPENNEQCIFVKPEPIFSDPFPNPAQDEVVVEVVLPEPDNITINLVNSQGQTVYNQIVSDTQAGINSISLDLQTFRAGNYVLLVFYQGWERSYNVVLVK